MIHRVVYGAIERFMGVLIEHFAGQFPVWLAPQQIAVLPISERFNDYTRGLVKRVKKAGLRCEGDYRSEKIGYKIREARNERIPYLFIIGEKEAESGGVSVRSRHKGDEGAMSLEDILSRIQQEVRDKVIFEEAADTNPA
jgi:threonyl-tRNA synthetase